jgi:hypothetical protein
MITITPVAEPAASAQAASAPARSGYVCANPLCGSMASYPGTCCGQPMVAR